MEKIFEGHIVGSFKGWNTKYIYEISSGSKWKLAKYKHKSMYKYRPKAKLWQSGSEYYLGVEGMDEKVKVRRV